MVNLCVAHSIPDVRDIQGSRTVDTNQRLSMFMTLDNGQFPSVLWPLAELVAAEENCSHVESPRLVTLGLELTCPAKLALQIVRANAVIVVVPCYLSLKKWRAWEDATGPWKL